MKQAPTFALALKAVLIHEGGYVNHPRDPGGPTMKGVTQRVYDGYRKRRSRPVQSVQFIEPAEVEAIYRQLYADAIRFDELPPGVAYVVFDGAVNSGPAQAVKWLQRALGCARIDGQIGEETLGRIASWPGKNYDRLISAVLDRRLAFLQALKTWPTFGKGWTSRVAGVRKLGQAWAQGDVGPMPEYAKGGERKATIVEAKPAPPRAPGDLATGTGIATGGAGGALDQAKEALQPLAGSSDWIATIVAALVLTGLVMALGGIAWRVVAARRAAAREDALDLVEFPQAASS